MYKLMEKRWGMVIVLIIATVLGTFILGGLPLGAIMSAGEDKPFLYFFWRASKFFYLIFFAGCTVGCLLILLTKIPEQYAIGFGYGLYYGTFGASFVVQEFFHLSDRESIVLGFVIAALVCLVVWFAFCKPHIDKYS